jgi:hypothetical protein
MKNIQIHCSWDLKFDLFHEKQIELYVDQIPNTPIPEGVVRFVFLLEPPEIVNHSHHALHGLQHNTYNYLLTHNQELINASDRALLFEFGTTWIRDYVFTDKEYSISALVGGKLMANGHYLRQEVLTHRHNIVTPRNFYISSHYPPKVDVSELKILGNDKTPLFDSQFHICIENTKRLNWFTEKLIDCLVTKTIPIYWGCPNIGDWFDLDGIIIVNNLDDFINVCNSLNENTYNEKLEAVNKNYEIAKKLANIDDRLIDKINSILNEQ